MTTEGVTASRRRDREAHATERHDHETRDDSSERSGAPATMACAIGFTFSFHARERATRVEAQSANRKRNKNLATDWLALSRGVCIPPSPTPACSRRSSVRSPRSQAARLHAAPPSHRGGIWPSGAPLASCGSLLWHTRCSSEVHKCQHPRPPPVHTSGYTSVTAGGGRRRCLQHRQTDPRPPRRPRPSSSGAPCHRRRRR